VNGLKHQKENGNPNIGEPLSCAWERFTKTEVWEEYCDKWKAMRREHFDDNEQLDDKSKAFAQNPRPRRRADDYEISPFHLGGALIGGEYLRHELIVRFPGATEKEKLERIFASVPP
jgi:hypothetical protein